MIEIKLKPCPFCGGENVSFVADRHAVVCKRCKARGGIAPDEDMALSMWNDRRAEPLPAPRAVHVGSVATFESVKPDKAQALKVLEEASEAYAAWQDWAMVHRRSSAASPQGRSRACSHWSRVQTEP